MMSVPTPPVTAVDVDALDKLRAAALTIRQMYPSDPTLVQNETDVEAVWSDGGNTVLAECYGEDVAALIVAAVNALRPLLAEVRRGRALREAVLSRHERVGGDCVDCGGVKWPCPTVALVAAVDGDQ